jgi:hypothetical protein
VIAPQIALALLNLHQTPNPTLQTAIERNSVYELAWRSSPSVAAGSKVEAPLPFQTISLTEFPLYELLQSLGNPCLEGVFRLCTTFWLDYIPNPVATATSRAVAASS